MAWNRPALDALKTRVEQDVATTVRGTTSLLRYSFYWIIARIFAGVCHLIYGYIAWVYKQFFILSCDEERLLEYGSELSITRNEAVAAIGSVTFSGTPDTEIPAGTLLQREDGVEYETTETGIVGDEIDVEALIAGENGNVADGYLTLSSPIAGVDDDAEITSALIGGSDEEALEDYRDRVWERRRNPDTGGNLYDYERAARAVSGVRSAYAFADYDDVEGQVGVMVLGVDPFIPGGDLLDAVEAALMAKFAPGVNIVAFAPTMLPIRLTLYIYPQTTAIKAAVEASIEDTILRFGRPDDYLLAAQFSSAIQTTGGVTNYRIIKVEVYRESAWVDIPDFDVQIMESEFPELDSIIWEESY